MNRELLEKPFRPEQIKQREGNFGKVLDYVEGHTILKRLNDSLDAQWSFVIVKHEIIKETDEVIVLGELSTGDIKKTQFGSSRITRARNTGDMVSLSDDLKAAATDSLDVTSSQMSDELSLQHIQIDTRNHRFRKQQEVQVSTDDLALNHYSPLNLQGSQGLRPNTLSIGKHTVANDIAREIVPTGHGFSRSRSYRFTPCRESTLC